MARFALFVAAVALVLAPAAHGSRMQLMPGVSYEHKLQWTSAGPVQTNVVTAPKPGGLYTLTPLLSNESVTGREPVSAMERRVAGRMTTVGVNGDFFNWGGGWPTGVLLRGGVLEHHPAHNRSAVGVDGGGVLHVDRLPFNAKWQGFNPLPHPIAQLNEPPRENTTALFTPAWGATTPRVPGTALVLQPFPPATQFRDLTSTVTRIVTDSAVQIPPDGAVLVARGLAADDVEADAAVGQPLTVRLETARAWSAVTDAVGGGPALVRGGKIVPRPGESLTPTQLFGREPRTAIGQRAGGGIVLVVVDGRRRGWSVGITNRDLALTLVRAGCVTGMALDSGGSSTLAFDGGVLNRPSDGNERPVAEAVVIGYTGVYAPPPSAPTLSPNGDGIAERQRLAYKLVRPATVTATLAGPAGAEWRLDTGLHQPGRYGITWNGTVPGGGRAPEGGYRWVVTGTDDQGRASTARRTFRVDATLGFPRVGRNARTISFALSRPATVRVTIEDPAGNALVTLRPRAAAAGEVTFRWNGRDGKHRVLRPGSYVVRIWARGEIGASQLRVPVTIRR